MLTRKTQYAWMAVGGMICLFGLVLACKLRDGNKAIAQADKPLALPSPFGDDKEPSPPPPPPLSKAIANPGLPFASTPEMVLPPKRDKGKGTLSQNTVLEMPMPVMESPSVKPPDGVFKSGLKTVEAPTPPPPPSLPPIGSVVPASFGPNAPTPKNDKKEPSTLYQHDAKAPDPKPIKPTTSSPSALDIPQQLSSKESPTLTPSWNNPEGKVAPTSFAPVTATSPSGGHGTDHEAKSQPGEPPLAPAPGPVQIYRVRGSETLHDIARRTLGSSDRWTDLHKLNPSLKPDAPLRAGTTVRLPGDACVQADDAEPVKPLPALRPKPAPPKAKTLPLTGTYQCSLDDKNQLTLPRALRDQLGGSDTVLVSPGPDKCLWLTNQPHLERLGERLEQSRANEADVRVFKRLYFAQTEKLSVNADGRVAIPDRLATFAGLHQELVLVGIDDHFEVWDAARWRQYTQQKGRSTVMVEE